MKIIVNELSKDELMTLRELAFYWTDRAHNSNFESHRVKASFSHLTLCVRRCSSPASILIKAFGLNVFDLTAGNGRLLACTTTKVTVSIITISIGTYDRSLAIVIDFASLLRDNFNEHLFTNNNRVSTYEDAMKLQQYWRTAKAQLQVGGCGS